MVSVYMIFALLADCHIRSVMNIKTQTPSVFNNVVLILFQPGTDTIVIAQYILYTCIYCINNLLH